MVKFLIIRFSSIGDIVLTTPVIRCLKQQVKETEIHFLTKPAFSSILLSNPYIDKVLTLKEKFSETISEIWNERYDYIIDLHNNIRTRRIKNRIGILSFSFYKLNIEKWLLVNFKINKLPDKHIVDRYLETVRSFDITNDNKGLDYFIPENDEIDLKKLPEFLHSGYVGFVIGAKHFTKKMPAQKISEIISKIPFPVILFGGKEDIPQAEQIISTCNNKNIFNSCGKFNLNQSASLVKQSKVIVSHDTGLMHIAAAFQKPVISLWGNTVPEFGMYPYIKKELSEIIEIKHLKCRPCTKIGFNKCPKKHFRCMNDIDNNLVVNLVEKHFENRNTL
ncbi:MAG: glycosyl transferase [Bacteroidetes bacterium CG23_combo_of_CG06-09_8_20_14_all_32_9]|nr:MAG: glycosyl transferase [Bacteroidetes bacterium CG23_combo_of_CG06-09_8_20_14_all_32_9]